MKNSSETKTGSRNKKIKLEENKILLNDTDFFEIIRPIIDEGGIFPVTVTGNSMFPFLASGRDTVYISRPGFPLKKGDIAFFTRADGKIVMHRILSEKDGRYSFIGDAQTVIENNVDEKNIFGVVKKVIRKGKDITKGNLCWDFFEKIWINIIGLRPLIMGVYKKIMW